MHTILVATDLSERSDRAVRRAIRLAGQLSARCHAIHVIDNAMPEDLAHHLRDEADGRLQRFIGANRGAVAVTAETLVGDPLEVIPEAAGAAEAGLIVLGTHRPRAFLDSLRETTVERLVRLIHRPVLLVRDPADHSYANVLALVSFSPACAAALRAARALAPEAKITPVHAIYLPFTGLTGEGPGGAMDRELTREAKTARDQWQAREELPQDIGRVNFVHGGLNEAVERERRSHAPDLIALGAHTRGPVSPHVLGGFAASLVRHPPTDLLLAHPG